MSSEAPIFQVLNSQKSVSEDLNLDLPLDKPTMEMLDHDSMLEYFGDDILNDILLFSEIPTNNEPVINFLQTTNDTSEIVEETLNAINIDLPEVNAQNFSDFDYNDLMIFDFETKNDGINLNNDIVPQFKESVVCEQNNNIIFEEHTNTTLNEDQYSEESEDEIIEVDDSFKNYVLFPKKTVHGKLHLARDKPFTFSFYYDKSSDISNEWNLYINLTPEDNNPNKVETLKFCSKDKHNKNYWFFCNEIGVKLGEQFKIPLLDDRRGRDFNLRFPCNNSCSSMFAKSKLQFTIIDANNVICFEESFNIRICERPGRDERELAEKIGEEKLIEPQQVSYAEYVNIINDPEIIRKEYPKLTDHTMKDCKFEICLTNKNKVYEGNKFSEQVEKQVYFQINELSVPSTIHGEKFFVRCMIVDPKFPENPIICNNHGNPSEERGSHILRSSCDEAEYLGSRDGIYPDERLSVLIPAEVDKEISLYFMCNNLCYVDRDRKYAGLVVILENDSGKMFARRFFKFAIVSRPKRSELRYESDDEAAKDRFLKRKLCAFLKPAKKRKS